MQWDITVFLTALVFFIFKNEDHCQYHLGIGHCQTGNRCMDAVRMEMSMQIDDQDQWSTLKYN